MKIYLAHPISGLSYEDVVGYYKKASDDLTSMGYCPLCPMTGKDYLRNETKFRAEGYDNPVSTNRAILGRDHWMVHQSDLVYFNLTGATQASIGCCMELAFAYAYKKHTVVVMEKDNIHRHAFVNASADIIFETHEDAMLYLKTLIKGV